MFKKGDRVYFHFGRKGCGTIYNYGREYCEDREPAYYGVRMDEKNEEHGHSLDGQCEDGYGMYIPSDCLVKLNEREVFTIYQAGDKVIVSDKMTGKCTSTRTVDENNSYLVTSAAAHAMKQMTELFFTEEISMAKEKQNNDLQNNS